MFLLDTNVLSAMMTSRPAPEIDAWVGGQAAGLIFTATVCQAEILAGLAILPDGRRRAALQTAAQAMFVDDLEGRIWPFDAAAVAAYADLFAARRASGRPTAAVDLMIAAIARARGAIVVTRNVSDFEGCGLGIVNPWTVET